jgi:hypothetical protein
MPINHYNRFEGSLLIVQRLNDPILATVKERGFFYLISLTVLNIKICGLKRIFEVDVSLNKEINVGKFN